MELTRDQYQELVRTLADGILVVDESGEILYESPAVQRLTGYAPEERTGDHVFEHVHPDDQRRVREAFADVLESEAETVVTAEFRFRHKDGSWVWLETKGSTQQATTIGGYIVRVSDITEAKAREEHLERTTARLEALFENSPDMIDVHTTDGTIVDVNRQFCEAFDEPKAEIVGRKVWEIDQKIGPDELREIWDRMDVGERTEIETVFETGDGTRFPVEVHLTRLPVNDGDRFVVISRDITERTEQLREIRSLKNRLELAVEGANLGVWDWDMRTDAVEFNDQWAEMLGYELDELEPHLDTWETRVHPDDMDGVSEALDVHRRGETDHYDTTHRLRTADGEWKWIRDLGRIVERDADGEPVRAVGIHLDIDDAKRYQRELERKTEELERQTGKLERKAEELEDLTTRLEEQYRTLFEEAPVMAVVTRAENGRPVIEDCNNQFADALGVDPDALVGAELADFYVADSETALIDDGGYEAALDGEFTNEPRELVTADGEVIETRLRAVPRKNAAGEVVGTLAMYIDVTERETVKRANERLEEFASIVSHDLRNPLNVATGHLELAREDCESPHLEAVDRAHGRMETLIEDLLALAREGASVAETDAVDLAALAGACWETVETADATLVIDDDRVVVADETRLRQLFENLMRNAVEHSSTSPRSHARGDPVEHGGPDVTVTVGALEDGFYVEDDGPGIPEADRSAVFEAGFSTNAEGTGFGLSIVERIAEAHGWDVRVTSGAAGGARFEITGVEFASE